MHGLLWTFRGIPTLYYGSEIEFQKGKQIGCGPTRPLATTGRAYYGDAIEGTVTAGDYGVVSGASGTVAMTLSRPLVTHLQRLNRIRRAIPALQMGQYSTEGVSGEIAYKRRYTSTRPPRRLDDPNGSPAQRLTGDPGSPNSAAR